LKKPVLIVLLFAMLPSLIAQAADGHEFQLWTEAGLRYKLSKNLRLGFDQHFRFDKDASEVESIMPELYLTYRVIKRLRIRLGYRFMALPVTSQEDAYCDTAHRFYADLRYRYRAKPFRIRARLRYQEQFGWPWDEDGDIQARHTFRQKLFFSVSTPLGLEPFVAGELFLRFGDPDGVLHKWRGSLGLSYELDRHELSIFYRAEGMLDDDTDPLYHILGLAYSVRLN